MKAPPTSTRAGPAGAKPYRSYSRAVASGEADHSATWSRSYSTSVSACDERQEDPLPRLEHVRCALRQGCTCGGQVGDAERDVLQRSLLTRALGIEQGQLPAARVAPEQGEVLLVRDHVHADVTLEERGDGRAVRDPERDVIESLRLHGRERYRPRPGCRNTR